MADLIYDGRKLTVPPGTNLVDAGAMAGVSVPIFCYHKDLGAVGSCRVCAVTVKQGDKSRTVMGCMTEAQDGMEVTTLDDYSVQLRKRVLEWLMINHPHDCPICDEGGECQLQDLTIASGHGVRRYTGSKRTFQNQHLGEFIQHEMNRCITCYRCARFYQEYAGGRDFSATGSRDRVYFGRFEEGPFESAFSGNLVELCPTGVFTDKLFRYKSRVWDLEIAPSVCPHCSIGCNVLPGSRFRELQRVRMRENPAVNGGFLCDRGQFGHGYVMDPARPRTVRVHGEPSSWEQAVESASGTLLELARRHGPKSIALMASARASVETHHALRQLATGPLAGVRVAHFDDAEAEARAQRALAALAGAGAAPLDQGDIAHCDVLLVAGTSLVDEAPLAALAARQVARRNGRVFVLSPIERYLADVATVRPTPPAELAAALRGIAGAIGAANGGEAADVARALAAAERPGVLLGCDLMDAASIAAGAEIAKALIQAGKPARLGTLFPGPNACGAALFATEPQAAGILAALEAGELRALVLVECEPSSWTARARKALESLELLVALDYLPGTIAEQAHVLLPTTATYESDGAMVNRAGRLQSFARGRVPGVAVRAMIQNESFPRQPRRTPPEGDARFAWAALEALRERVAGKPGVRPLGELRDELERSAPIWRPMRNAVAGEDGIVLDLTLASRGASADTGVFDKAPAQQGLALFRMDRTLGSEVLSRRPAAMQTMAGPPMAWLSVADAQGLGDPARVVLEAGGATVEVAARAHAGVAPGVVIVPRDVEWSLSPRQGAAVRVTAAVAEEARR